MLEHSKSEVDPPPRDHHVFFGGRKLKGLAPLFFVSDDHGDP